MLPELIAEDRKPDRPKDDEAENHGDDLERRPARARPPPTGVRPFALAEFPRAVGTTHRILRSAHYEPPCPLASGYHEGAHQRATSDWEPLSGVQEWANVKKHYINVNVSDLTVASQPEPSTLARFRARTGAVPQSRPLPVVTKRDVAPRPAHGQTVSPMTQATVV